MKFNLLIKSITFLSTFILITTLSLFNQKENIKLKILIWDTPSLPIGTYIAISSGTGFIFSYVITTYLSKVNHPSQKKIIREERESENKNINEFNEINHHLYDNTLIERDLNDASPTINASFRVIGKIQKSNSKVMYNERNQYEISNNQYEKEYQNDDLETLNENENNIKSNINDWEDDSYSNW